MFDGNGNWTSDFSAQADRDNGIKILASRFDNIFIADIKESFENCLTKDGQIAPIGAFNMGGQKITNLGSGSNPNDAVNKGQLDTTVKLTGEQTIYDIKTFNESPIIPTPDSDSTGQEAININWYNSQRNTIMRLMGIDVASSIARSINTTYTATRDCWVFHNENANNTSTFYVDGVAVYQTTWHPERTSAKGSALVFVAKGQTWRAENGNSVVEFGVLGDL